jgi:hydrogenase/urease accessory protein HupE
MRYALAIALLLPAPAHAHAPGFAVLELEEHGGGRVTAVLRSATPLEIELAGCEQDEASSSQLESRFGARCPRGVTELEARGLDEPGAQLFVVLHRRDGTIVRGAADAHRPRIDLRAPESGALRYVRLGIEHVAFGFDHLLFVLGLLLLVKSLRRTALTVTAFTLGHSITLALAVLDLVRVPAPFVECMIALSILLLALELARDRDTLARRRPEIVAASFGLLHGLGFASALRDAGLPEDGLAAALFGFNAGVELGQLAFVVLVVSAIVLAKKSGSLASRAPLARSIAVHALGAAAAYWTLERAIALGA